MDASAATLAWVGWLKGDLEFTVLYHFYRSHLIDVDAMQAFEMGFIPPAENKFPSHVLEGLPNTLPVWSCHGGDTTVFDLIFKTALWLGLARGFPALHLFCDMVKHFTLHKPYRAITYERAKFLQQLVRMRVHSVSIRLPSEEAPFPYKDREFSDKNPDYFIDVAKSHVVMAKELEKKLTLIERPRLSGDLAKYKLRDPPCTPRDTLKRRNTIAGSYPMDVESKNTASHQFPPRSCTR